MVRLKMGNLTLRSSGHADTGDTPSPRRTNGNAVVVHNGHKRDDLMSELMLDTSNESLGKLGGEL